MKIADMAGKSILILGYGKEGRSTEKFLRKNVPSCNITISDKSIDDNYLDQQAKFDIVIKTPGIPKGKMKVPYTTATNIFFANKGPRIVIGVTGTKGKSTTASLIAHIIKYSGRTVYLIGNIGVPALSVFEHELENDAIFVYEFSSYQLDDIKYSPEISVVVSLFPDHINYHGSVEKYYLAKKNILSCATSNSIFAYNPKYTELGKWAKEFKGRSITVATDYSIKNTNLVGPHNIENIQLAVVVVRQMGISDEISRGAIESFQPLSHRLEIIGVHNKVTYIDDAISTTPESTIAALNSFQNIQTILLGGEDRGYKFDNLALELAKKEVEFLVLFPDSGDKINEAVEKIKTFNPEIFETSSMEDAVKFCVEKTNYGMVCMLSSASPSYSLWKDFNEKGDQFQEFVKKYAKEYKK